MPGSTERRVARGALLGQVSQVWGTACMLAMITVLARRLELSEFGVYGLFVSVAGYLLIVQMSIEGAAVRAIAGASNEAERERVFTSVLLMYVVAGLVAGVLIAALGALLSGVLGVPDELRPEARRGVLFLAVLTAIGWPAKAFQDLLRGLQLFGAAALAEMVAYGVVAGGVVAMSFADAPLSLLIGLGGGISATVGLWCLLMARLFRVPVPYRRGSVTRDSVRELGGISGYLLVSGLADLVIYSMDRVILAAFKGPVAVGLYESAIRPYNLLRTLHGTLVLTVTPVASSLRAEDDAWRAKELLVRGTRYVLAVVSPVATTLVVLAGPIIEVWVGDRYAGAAGAMMILAGYWVLAGNTGPAGGILLAAGRVRVLTAYAWVAAIGNLILALSLTPSLGLSGVALGIAVPPTLMMPVFLWLALNEVDGRFADLGRTAWLPAGVSCAVLAGFLLAARELLQPDSLATVGALAGGGLALTFALYWFVWFDAGERRLVRGLLRPTRS